MASTSTAVGFLDRLPTWISINLKSKTSWKLLSRCWLASWVAFLLLLPHKSLLALGNAAFFCCIASFIVPPFLPVQMFFFAMAIMLFGCLFGWALGVAAMRAALAARDPVILHSAIQKAQQTAAGQANPDALFTLQIFQGAFLDSRSSVIFGVFLGTGAFLFALIRAYNPKLALFSVFGTVFLDVICLLYLISELDEQSYGPLFPASQYLILNSFFISTSSYVAIGCAAILLVFPETLNHQYLNSISSVLATVRELVEIQSKVLCVTDPAEVRPDSQLRTEARTKTDSMIASIQKLDTQSGMLGLEFTFGRFNSEDAKNIGESLKKVVARIAGLQSFSRFIGDEGIVDPDSTSEPNKLSDTEKGDTYLLRHLRSSHHKQELERGLRPQDILPILNTATADLRVACVNGLLVAEQLIVRVNRRRWQHTPVEPEPNVEDHLAELLRAREDFQQRRRLEVVEPFSGTRPYRALFMAFVFQANLVWCADSIISVLEVLSDLTVRRRKARVWAPTGLRLLWKVLRSKDESDKRALGEDERPADVDASGKDEELAYRLDPDSSPPKYAYQHIGETLYHVYKWCRTPEAIYAAKYTVVSIAIWLPTVFPRTAYFMYVNKGLWALIMAQTTLEPYIADQIYSYIARLTATTAGIVIGLAGCAFRYIGAGHGNGNPYGIAAVVAVLLLPLMFWRLFTPSPLPAIMCSVTTILVMGYSWLDAHLTIVGSPGVGWPVGWRRWVLVMTGAGASFLLMLMPPKSGRRAVRLSHAALVFDISQLYARLVSRWITGQEGARDPSPLTHEVSPSTPPQTTAKQNTQVKPEKHRDLERNPLQADLPEWASAFRLEIGGVWAKAQRLRIQTETAKWEGNVRGAWPAESYFELLDVETEMLANLAQLAGALLHSDPDWRMRLVYRTKILNPNFISDVITMFTLVSQSLRTGEPLHEVLPHNLIDRVFYHHTLLPTDDPDTKRLGEVDDTLEQLRSQEYMAYATGVSAVFQILTLLDHLHRITTKLCGEVPLKGFREWRDVFEKRRVEQHTIPHT